MFLHSLTIADAHISKQIHNFENIRVTSTHCFQILGGRNYKFV